MLLSWGGHPGAAAVWFMGRVGAVPSAGPGAAAGPEPLGDGDRGQVPLRTPGRPGAGGCCWLSPASCHPGLWFSSCSHPAVLQTPRPQAASRAIGILNSKNTSSTFFICF